MGGKDHISHSGSIIIYMPVCGPYLGINWSIGLHAIIYFVCMARPLPTYYSIKRGDNKGERGEERGKNEEIIL